jgi:hypothetical protein
MSTLSRSSDDSCIGPEMTMTATRSAHDPKRASTPRFNNIERRGSRARPDGRFFFPNNTLGSKGGVGERIFHKEKQHTDHTPAYTRATSEKRKELARMGQCCFKGSEERDNQPQAPHGHGANRQGGSSRGGGNTRPSRGSGIQGESGTGL